MPVRLSTLTRVKRDGKAFARHFLAPATCFTGLGASQPRAHCVQSRGLDLPLNVPGASRQVLILALVPRELSSRSSRRVNHRQSYPLAGSDVPGDIVTGCILRRILFSAAVFKYKAEGCSSFGEHKYPFFLRHGICV